MDSNTIADNKAVSSHAKRRQQKKQKKETENAEQKAAEVVAAPAKKQEPKKDNKKKNAQVNADQKARDEIINKLKYSEEETKNSKDAEMMDETVPSQSETSSIKNGDDKKNRKRNYTKKPMDAQYFNAKLTPPKINDKEKVLNSNETGFMGEKETWFDDDLYSRPK